MSKYCCGCGVLIQHENKDIIGYAPKQGDYCMRCFQLTHYNKVDKIILERDKYIDLIKDITKKKALYVYIIDGFAPNVAIDSEIIKLLEGKDWLLVINKMDLYPKSLKKERIEKALLKSIPKTYLSVIKTAANKNYGIDSLVSALDSNYRLRDVYFIGSINVGKSSILNAILKSRVANYKRITVSKYGGTTADLLPIPFFTDGAMLYDTPGFVPKGGFLNHIETVKLLADKEINTKAYQLTEPQAFLINDFCKIEVYQSNNASIVFYLPNQLNIHRTKIEKGNEMFTLLDEYETKALLIEAKSDLVIGELGFIYFPNKVNVLITTYKGVDIIVRKSFVFTPNKRNI